MLNTDTRRRLKEHGWLDIAKKHSNPSMALSRFRTQAIEAIDDLVLMAQKLPEDVIKDIFNHANIKKLASITVRGSDGPAARESGISVDEVRRIQLAALLVDIGMRTCIELYRTRIEKDSDLNKLNIDHLWRAIEICNAISFKSRLPQLEKEAEKDALIYLFNWNRINNVHETKIGQVEGEDTNRFLNFLQDIAIGELGDPIDIINTINYDPHSYDWNAGSEAERVFEYTDIYGDHVDGNIWLNFEDKTGHLSMRVRGEEVERVLHPNLVVRIENEYIYVYRQRASESKLVARSKK